MCLLFASIVSKSKASRFASTVWVCFSVLFSRNGRTLSIKMVASSESTSGLTYPSCRRSGRSWFSASSRMSSTGLTCSQGSGCSIRVLRAAKTHLESRFGPSSTANRRRWSRLWRTTWRRSTLWWWLKMTELAHFARSIMIQTQPTGSLASLTIQSEKMTRLLWTAITNFKLKVELFDVLVWLESEDNIRAVDSLKLIDRANL